MSISPINTSSQTGLVPQSLLAYSTGGNSALEINSTSITIGGLLNTSNPIFVEISAATGLTTTNPTGLDVNCSLNMNSNDITNLDTLSSATGGDLTLSSASDIYTNCQGLQLDAESYINLECNTGDISLQSQNLINITTPIVNNGSSEYNWDNNLGNKNQIGCNIINISDSNNNRSINGIPQYGINVINTPDTSTTPVTLATGIKAEGLQMSNDFDTNNTPNNLLLLSPQINVMVLTEAISNNNPTFKIIDASNYLTISSTNINSTGNLTLSAPDITLTATNPNGLDINCDLDMNNNDITELAYLKFNTGINISNNTVTAQILSNNTGQLTLQCANDLILTVNNLSMVELTDTTLTLTGNGPTGILMTSLSSDINLNTPFGSTFIDSFGLQVNASNFITLNANSGGVVSINSGDNTQITCGENFFVNTNSTTGIVAFTTGDLANSGVVRWNSYPMSMTFFNKWNGGFSYNNPGNWEMVKQNTISFPTQFLYGTWAVSFSINCSNVGSAPADKALAMYFSFIDGNSNPFDGFNYRQATPYANWFNASNYTATSQTPLSITYTDYFDFTGAINNLELQINWFANNIQTQNDFNVSTTFTLMTLI